MSEQNNLYATARDAAPYTIAIHGLWLTSRSWKHWIERREGLDHRVLSPSWPALDWWKC